MSDGLKKQLGESIERIKMPSEMVLEDMPLEDMLENMECLVPSAQVINDLFPDNAPLPPNASPEVRFKWFAFLIAPDDKYFAHEATDAFIYHNLSIPPELGKWIQQYKQCWYEQHKKSYEENLNKQHLFAKLDEMAHLTKVLDMPVDDAADYVTRSSDIFWTAHSKETLKEYYRKSTGKKARQRAEEKRSSVDPKLVELRKQAIWDYLLRKEEEQ